MALHGNTDHKLEGTGQPSAFRKPGQPSQGYFIKHPNGQTSHYKIDDFTDPWIPTTRKEILLLQHGCVHTTEFWYPWITRLARKYIVIRRDARGHGGSSFPKRLNPWSEHATANMYEGGYDYSAETIVDEVYDFLDQLGIKRIHFIAEATSGEVASIFAARYPERIASLITVSSPTMLPPEALKLFCVGKASWPEAVMELGAQGWADALTRNPGTIGEQGGDAYRRWWLDAVGVTHREGLAGYVIFLSSLSSKSWLKDIKCPTLILAPTNSAAVPMTESKYMKNQIPGAHLVEINGTGHEVFIECADECIDAVDKFLLSLVSKGQA